MNNKTLPSLFSMSYFRKPSCSLWERLRWLSEVTSNLIDNSPEPRLPDLQHQALDTLSGCVLFGPPQSQ